MSNRKTLSRAQVAEMDYPYAWPPESVLNPGSSFKWVPEVVFDFHQVIANWTEQYVKFLNQTYGWNIDHTKVNFYHMQFDPSIPLTPEQHEKAFASFCRLARGGYGSLKMYPGMKETIAKLQNYGIRVRIYTFCPGVTSKLGGGEKSHNHGEAQQATMELIRKLDLPIDVDRDVVFISPDGKGWKMAEEHIPLIVEDNASTAVLIGMNMAHAAILVNEPHSIGLIAPNVLPLKDRKDLANIIISFYQKLDEAGLLL